jgi:hypothetical protein
MSAHEWCRTASSLLHHCCITAKNSGESEDLGVFGLMAANKKRIV